MSYDQDLLEHSFDKYLFTPDQLAAPADGLIEPIPAPEHLDALPDTPTIYDVVVHNERAMGGGVVFLAMGRDTDLLAGKVTRPMSGETAHAAVEKPNLTYEDLTSAVAAQGELPIEEDRLKLMEAERPKDAEGEAELKKELAAQKQKVASMRRAIRNAQILPYY